jgi:starch phosphorylase
MDSPTTAPRIAYFSMEIAIDPGVPTYSGGLGILAGDTLRAAADLGVPMVAVSLLYRKGYFLQRVDAKGNQTSEPYDWDPAQSLELLPTTCLVEIRGRTVRFQAWRYLVEGLSGHAIPAYFLDTDLPENDARDRTLTDALYGGDQAYRLAQETLLGIGGVALLRELGHDGIEAYHLNEGHAALLTLALLEERLGGRAIASAGDDDLAAVRERCVFTIHTPVPAGHDSFRLSLAEEILGSEQAAALKTLPRQAGGRFDMTLLAMHLSRSVNAVSLRHRQVTAESYPNSPVVSVTNGVHAATWTAPPLARLFDRHIAGWREDNNYLRYAVMLPLDELRAAHAEAKRDLAAEIERRAGIALDPDAFTLCFARRATGYKRADLLFADPDRLKRIVRRAGPLQVLYGGKAHPNDASGADLIRRVTKAAETLKRDVRVLYLEEYDFSLARYLVSGVDLWLNNPEKPLEASGTSGMKAALNGVPSLSTVDGWWVEGWLEGLTGWAIGEGPLVPSDAKKEAASLYDKLEYVIMPMFYKRPSAYAEVMRSAIAINGSFFNAQRMVEQYVANVYRLHSSEHELDPAGSR